MPAAKKKKHTSPTTRKTKKRRTRATVKTYAKKFRKDPAQALQDLVNCLATGNVEAFKKTVKKQYQSLNVAKILKQVELSRATFYEALSPEGNPGLETVAKLVKGLKKAKK